MYQCMSCEDWFHEICLNLRDHNAQQSANDDDSEDAGPNLRLPRSKFDAFVCSECVLNRDLDLLTRYAGTPGFVMLETMGESADDNKHTSKDDDDGAIPLKFSNKREHSDEVNGEGEENDAKRFKTEEAVKGEGEGDVQPSAEATTAPAEPQHSQPQPQPQPESQSQPQPPQDTAATPCHAPPPHASSQQLLTSLRQNPPPKPPSSAPRADMFLLHGWREKWCKCDNCLTKLSKHPWLIAEEATYEPQEEEQTDKTLFQLGTEALNSLPREKTLDGLKAYEKMSSSLKDYLKPFAESGKTVEANDIQSFFAEQQQKMGNGGDAQE